MAALSSTAIVSKLLSRAAGAQRSAWSALDWRVLLFQDLAVVPADSDPRLCLAFHHLWQDLGLAALKVMGVMVLLFSIGQRVMRQ